MQIVVPEHGRNISYDNFLKVYRELSKLRNHIGPVEVVLPTFIRPYVVNLFFFYYEHNPSFKARIKASVEVRSYLNNIILPGVFAGKTSFLYTKQTETVYSDFAKYLEKNSIHLPNEIIRDVGELCENSVEHSNGNSSDGTYGIFAQYFPNVPKLEICITDCGVGIAKNIYDFLLRQKSIPSFEEIEKKMIPIAFRKQLTTRPSGQGGSGLCNLYGRLKENKLKLTVVTNNYYYDIGPKIINIARLPVYFEGTLIHLVFDL